MFGGFFRAAYRSDYLSSFRSTYPEDGAGPTPPGPPRAGLRAWFDAGKDVTLSGSDVTAWADQSGNGNDLTLDGASSPAFTASTINGKPGITFSTVNQILQNTSTNLLASGSDRMVLVVCQPTTGSGGTFDGGGTVFCFRGSNAIWWMGLGSIGADTYGYSTGSIADTIPGAPTILDVPFLAEMSGAAGDAPVYTLNGTTYPLSADTPLVPETGTTGFMVGNYVGASVQFFAGTICEVLVYDHTLTGSDLAAARAYLNDKYFPPGPPTAGLTAWFKADAGISLSGSNVTAWADQSGNGNDVTAFGSPVFDASVINGKPGVSFPSAADYLTNTGTSLVATGAPRHVIAVVKCGSTASPGGPLVVFRTATPWFAAYFATIGASTYAYSDGATTAAIFSSPPSLTNTAFEVEVASTGTGPTGLTAAIDQANAPTLSTVVADESGPTGFTIGAAPGALQFFDGDICELLVFDHVLTSPDLAQVRAYLTSRYGVL